MSKEDLNDIQLKLKATIQHHQVLVGKLKNDPKNAEIAQELRSIQMELTSLNERQRQIVLQLRRKMNAAQQSSGTTLSQQTNQAVVSSQEPHQTKQDTAASRLHQQRPSIVIDTVKSHHHHHHSHHHSGSHSPKTASQVSPKSGHHHGHRPSILQGAGQRGGFVLRVQNDLPLVPVKTPTETKDLKGILRSAMEAKNMSPEEIQKIEYMASLNLITRDRLMEIQSRRSERKRRSTAKPQFSYVHGHLQPERKRSSVTTDTDTHTVIERKRGRPPRSSNNSPQPPTSIGRDDESCAVCQRTGQLFSCDSCSRLYHHTCLSMTSPPPSKWQCPKCQPAADITNQPSNNDIVGSYLLQKQMKEKEKVSLALRKKQLEQEKVEMEQKARMLKETIFKQVEHKKELLHESKEAEERLKTLKNILQSLHT